MSTRDKTSVLIVGAGPTGLALAIELGRQNVAFRIIDAAPKPSELSRALGIQSRTLEVFHSMGIIDEILAAGLRISGAEYYSNGEKLAQFNFDGLDAPYPFFIILPQAQTEKILTARCESLGVKIERGLRLESFTQNQSGVSANITCADGSHETIAADYIVGCDGAHSAVRHGLNMDFIGSENPEHWLLADLVFENPAAANLRDDSLQVNLSNAGPLVLFPLPGNRFRIFGDQSVDSPEDNSPEFVQRFIQQRGLKVKILRADWISHFRIHQRYAKKFRVGRAFLAGDAAHIHSPAGGQGMNTGIQDACNLAWKIAITTEHHANEKLLDSYEAERLPIDRAVVRNTTMLTRAVTWQNPIARSIRQRVLPLLLGMSPVKSKMQQEISQLAVGYRKSPIVRGRAALRAGERMIDRPVQHDSVLRRLHKLIADPHHTLLGVNLSDADANRLRTLLAQSQFANLFDVRIVGDLHTKSDLDAPAIYLVRPDGYIGFASQAPIESAIEDLEIYFKELFMPQAMETVAS